VQSASRQVNAVPAAHASGDRSIWRRDDALYVARRSMDGWRIVAFTAFLRRDVAGR
jgi:hypothetical protein